MSKRNRTPEYNQGKKRKTGDPLTPAQRHERSASQARIEHPDKIHTVFIFSEAMCVLEKTDFDRYRATLTDQIVSHKNSQIPKLPHILT